MNWSMSKNEINEIIVSLVVIGAIFFVGALCGFFVGAFSERAANKESAHIEERR